MQGTLIVVVVWISVIALAFVAASVMGLVYPFVSRETKEKLKEFEIESGYKCRVIYRDNPIVVIEERFNPGIVGIIMAVILFVAWLLFVSGIIMPNETNVTLTLLFAIIFFGLHLFAWVTLCALYLVISIIRFFTIKKHYEWHKARIETPDRVSLISIFNSL